MSALALDPGVLLAGFDRFLWPLLRCSALVAAAPVLGTRMAPARVRLLLALALAAVLALALPPPPALPMFGGAWWLAVIEQVAIGLALGFTMQVVFEAAMLAAELIAAGSGLGFAQLADPIRGTTAPVVGQLFSMLAMLLFLALDGHHLLIRLLADSFTTLPVGAGGLDAGGAWAVANLGVGLFATGLAIALPAVAALLAVNLAFGAMARAAPTLNLFSVGFPAALVVALLVMDFSLPALQHGLVELLGQALEVAASLVRRGG